ncbi:MAG: hypothetical protein ACO24G_02990 [Burkholderiaceae bacterium]|jgi:hypothetical protein
MKEWLLIVWIGTSTNLQVVEQHWSEEHCQTRAKEVQADLGASFTVACTQDLKEGRSQLPKRGAVQGVAK